MLLSPQRGRADRDAGRHRSHTVTDAEGQTEGQHLRGDSKHEGQLAVLTASCQGRGEDPNYPGEVPRVESFKENIHRNIVLKRSFIWHTNVDGYKWDIHGVSLQSVFSG